MKNKIMESEEIDEAEEKMPRSSNWNKDTKFSILSYRFNPDTGYRK